MRILYWTSLFWPYIGGVEVVGARFVRAMTQRGHVLEVVTSHGSLELPDRADWDGIPVHRFRFQDALRLRDVDGILGATRAVAELKRRFRPDLVHFNLTDPSVYYEMRTGGAHRCPLLVAARVALSDDAGEHTLLRKAVGSAAWVTANSRAMHERLLRLDPSIASRSSVILNGVERPELEPSPLPVDPPSIVCIGRLVRDKGLDIAVDAFADVLRRFPTARLIIAGDGPERSALEARAIELGVEDAVRFRGWVAPESVPALVNEATVVVMPSRWQEAFGLVALEAAVMARPVVATRVGGLPEVVVDGETGLLVPEEDSSRLAAALVALLDDPERTRRLGARGRARAIDEFGFDAHVGAYDHLYEAVAT